MEPGVGARKLPAFPPEDPLDEIVPSNVRLRRRDWNRLDLIARAEGKSRNEVIAFFLEWACQDYERVKAAKLEPGHDKKSKK